MKKTRSTRTKALLLAGMTLLVGGSGFFSYWSLTPPGRTCGSCHEIEASRDAWTESAHREVTCGPCHGGALSTGWHSLTENARRVVGPFATPYHDDIRLSEQQVVAMIDRCRACHAEAYADWLASGHSMTYADVFLHEGHNRVEPPNNDCFRCHGMFYEGDIASLLTPDEAGAWRFITPEQTVRPAIPCLACHQIHAPGQPSTRPDYADPASIAAQRPPSSSGTGFYDRNERLFFSAALLPVLRLGEGDQSVTVSPASGQRICIQCHAPDASHRAGTSDDRTPRGVHEGLSCQSCHQPHVQEAGASCARCHPALSNCGLDVETMETSFRSPDSPHDIHFVACTDCHESEPPLRSRSRLSSRP